MHSYTAYGLQIHSDLALPELVSAPATHADVVVGYGEVPVALSSPLGRGVLYQAKPGQFLLRVDGIANYLVTDGATITIEPAPTSDARDVRVFLLNSAFGALLHQRGVLPLHASAIVTPFGAAAFVGHSGHGKSTLAGAFHQRGYRLLGDDMCVVRTDGGVPMASPAYPELLLWADMLHLVGGNGSCQPVRAGLEKYFLPTGDRFATQNVPLVAVYELTTTNTEELSLTRLENGNKLEVLIIHTFGGQFLDGLGMLGAHFRQASLVAHKVRVTRVRRPIEPVQLDPLVALIESDIQSFGE